MLVIPPVKRLFAAATIAFCIGCAAGEDDEGGEPAPRGLARGGSSGSGFGGTSPISRGGGSNGTGGSSGFGGSTGGTSGFGGVGGTTGTGGAAGSSGSLGVGGSLGLGGSGLFGGASGVAGSAGTLGSAGAPDRTPSPNNPKECPPMAPDNPIGPCIGLPVYLMCSYGTYNCICDWVHWICLG